MYVHQHAKVEPNWSTDGAAISADVHTRSPLHKLYFHYFYISYLYIYPTPIYGANENFLKFTDLLLPHMYTLKYSKSIKLSNKLTKMCSIPHEEILPQNVFPSTSSCHLYLQP